MAHLVFGRLTALLLAIMAFWPSGPAAAQIDEPEKPRPPTPKPTWRLPDQAAAVARAEAFLGTADSTEMEARASQVTLIEENTPHLNQSVVGRPMWRATINNWTVKPLKPCSPTIRDRYMRTVDVLLDPANGKLVSVRTRWPEEEPPIAPEPSAEWAAREMRSNREVYHGFPREQPPISFSEAVRVVQESGGNPLVAKQIVGRWIMWSWQGSAPKPMWIITLRGIPPIAEDVSPDAANHLRFIVDPSDMRVLLITTIPQPDPVAKEGNQGGDPDRSQWTLREADQAVTKARAIFGIREKEGASMSASLITLDKSDIPFLADQLVGEKLWRVTISNLSLRLNSAPELKDRFVRTFDVLLDPKTGRVREVKSRWPDGVYPVLGGSDPAVAAAQMSRSGREVYHGFPAEDPKVSLLDALDTIHRCAGNPLAARQVIGRYVTVSRGGQEPRAVWAITLRGVRPKPKHRRYGSRGEPWYQHRYIVDGETGEWILACGTPDPMFLKWKEDDE